jgi:hypothetical protein
MRDQVEHVLILAGFAGKCIGWALSPLSNALALSSNYLIMYMPAYISPSLSRDPLIQQYRIPIFARFSASQRLSASARIRFHIARAKNPALQESLAQPFALTARGIEQRLAKTAEELDRIKQGRLCEIKSNTF